VPDAAPQPSPPPPATAGPRVAAIWRRRGGTVLRAAIVVQAVAAAIWLGYQFWRLTSGAQPIWPGGHRGGVDLELLRWWGTRWFAGIDAYLAEGAAPHARSTYPPASYVLLWPFWGWLSLPAARWLWAAVCAAGLAWLARVTSREVGVTSPAERAAAALVPVAGYAAGANVGNGQLMLLLLPLAIAAVLHLHRAPPGARCTLIAAALALASLAKPSVTAPLFWVVLAAPGGLAAGALAAAGYVALTLFAGLFQEASLLVLLEHWAARVADVSGRAATNLSHGNLHAWMIGWGLESWYPATAAAIFAALGIWVARHRRVDPWLQLGVAAIVTRLMAYHGWYDDLVMLLPLVALVRRARVPELEPRWRAAAAALALLLWSVSLAPGGQYLLPPPAASLWLHGQVAIWLASLAGLVLLAARGPVVTDPSPDRVARSGAT
jgi:hypothetical protein